MAGYADPPLRQKGNTGFDLQQWQIETVLKDRLNENLGWTLGRDYVIVK